MLRRVGRLPGIAGKTRDESFVAKDVREFARNRTYDVTEVAIDGHAAKSIVSAARRYIRLHPDQCAGVSAALRQGRAFLVREEGQ